MNLDDMQTVQTVGEVREGSSAWLQGHERKGRGKVFEETTTENTVTQ
jgi:hypothetical protein